MAIIKNLGVLAFASAALAVPHSERRHAHARLHAREAAYAPPAYGESSSSSASISSSSSTPVAPIGTSAAPSSTGKPACWSTCFQKFGVTSEKSLCHDEEVDNCIEVTCSTEDVASYKSWLEKYCAPSSSAPFPYPSGNSSSIAGPTGTGTGVSGSTSLCTETSTLVYRTTTEESTYVITHYVTPVPGSATSAVSPPPGYESSAPSSAVPVGPAGVSSAGAYSNGGSGECTASDVTVTTTERTTVTVTAGGQESAGPSTVHVTSTYTAPAESSSSVESSSPVSPETTSAAAPPPVYSAPASSPASPASPETTATIPDKGHYSAPPAYTSEASATPSSTSEAPAPPAYTAPASSSGAVASSSSAAPPSYSSSAPPSSGFRGKRGIAYNVTEQVPSQMFDSQHIGWTENWVDVANGIDNVVPFIPTLHDGTSYWTSRWAENAQAGIDAGAPYLMGFNEPDNAGQANLSPSAAAGLWRTYMEPFAGKVKLCAPSVTNAPAGSGQGLEWLQDFMTECSDCTIDCINQHWYWTTGNDVSMFKEQIGDAITFAKGKDLFVGEFGAVGDASEVASFFGEIFPWMDDNDSITAYAYFLTYEGYLVEGSALSASGEAYCS